MKKRIISLIVIGVILLAPLVKSEGYKIAWDSDSIEVVLTPGTAEWECGIVMAPFVMYENGVYKMWYTGITNNTFGIGYVTSSDGAKWKDRRLVHGPYANCYQTHSPYVIKEGDTYKMWHSDYYEWVAGDWSAYISRMTSPDGINWCNEQKVLSAQGQSTPQGDGYGVAHPCVLKEEDQYIMWYAVSDHPCSGKGGPVKIWQARSEDGIVWKDRQLALPYIQGTWENNVSSPRVVKEPDGSYIMYHDSWILGGSMSIGRARSKDGVNWVDREKILDTDSYNHPFYFQDPITGIPYLYFTQAGNIVRMKGIISTEKYIKAKKEVLIKENLKTLRFALAMYYDIIGRWPDRLDALVPHYIDALPPSICGSWKYNPKDGSIQHFLYLDW